jgi:hypothetical protein
MELGATDTCWPHDQVILSTRTGQCWKGGIAIHITRSDQGQHQLKLCLVTPTPNGWPSNYLIVTTRFFESNYTASNVE